MHRTRHRKPQQIALWPTTKATCPRCRGAGDAYHRAAPPRVEVIGGKRIRCPTCDGRGKVEIPCFDSVGAAAAPRPVEPPKTVSSAARSQRSNPELRTPENSPVPSVDFPF